MEAEAPQKPKVWRLVYQDETYRESEMTMGMAEGLEDTLGLSWLDINPVRSARQARVILATMAAQRTGRPYDEIVAELASIPANVWLRDVWFLDDDDLPTEFTDGNPPEAGAP